MFTAALADGIPLKPAGAKLAIAEWTAPGTPSGSSPEWIAPLHLHRNDDEAWYVLEGTLGFRVGDDHIEAEAGQAVIVPGGIPHTYWNPKPETARYIIVMTANVSSLIAAIHATTNRDAVAMKELFDRFDSELLI